MKDMTNNNEILTIDELADILKMDRRNIQNRIVRDLPLPPSFKLPQCKTRLWRRRDVFEWINSAADEFIKFESEQRLKFIELTNLHRQKVKKKLSQQ